MNLGINNDKKAQLEGLSFSIFIIFIAGVILVFGIIVISGINDTVAFDINSEQENITADYNDAQTLSQTPVVSSSSATRKNRTWLEFDGINDFVADDFSQAPNDMWGFSNWTISIWFNTSGDSSTRRRIIGSIPNGGFFHLMDGNISYNYVNNANDLNLTLNLTGEVNDSMWHNLVLTAEEIGDDRWNMSFWLDGNHNNSVNWSDMFPNQFDSDWRLGDTGFSWFGYLDELRYYNRTITPVEISEIFSSGREANVNLPTTGLRIWMPLNENQGTTIHTFNQSDFT